MEPDCIIPIHEFVKIIKPRSILFVRIIPFFDFAINLRAFNWRQYVNDFILLEEIFKFAVSVTIFVPLVGIELSPMIGHHLANRCQPPEAIQSLLEEFDAVFRCLRIEFAPSKDAPRALPLNLLMCQSRCTRLRL